jgi:hypothetical protein
MDDEKLYIVLNFISNNDFPLIDNPEYLPENIGFREYLSIIEYLEKKQYIESIENDTIYGLTDVGVANFKLIRGNIEQQTSDKLAERKKLHNESVMSGWKRKTFWYIFALGLFGGIYSGIDLFNKITDNKEIQEKDNQEDELSKIKTISKDTLTKSTKRKNTQID